MRQNGNDCRINADVTDGSNGGHSAGRLVGERCADGHFRYIDDVVRHANDIAIVEYSTFFIYLVYVSFDCFKKKL